MKKVYIIRFLVLILLTGFIRPCLYGQCYKGDQKQQDPPKEQRDPGSGTTATLPIQRSSDPNEIIGTVGYDALGDTMQWVEASASLPYTIYFENDPNFATAAAQRVEVRHKLHAKASRSTFVVGTFGFGSHVFSVDGSPSSYQTRLDLVEDMGIYVDVVAGLDVVNNEAFWILQSIDPATGLAPISVDMGFLPVNDSTHCGEGFVSFTIKPNERQCVTGDTITAKASIVFDINEAIPTNKWVNTVDALPPTTQLTGSEVELYELLLQFTGSDDANGCGIKQYKLYVSDNYGSYQLYDTYEPGVEETFMAEPGHCYRFFCLGEDNVGNIEGMKEAAEYEYGNFDLLVTVAASPEEGGTVSGGGLFAHGAQTTVVAHPNAGFSFERWSYNGITVSTNPTYTFTVEGSRELVANFVYSGSVYLTQTDCLNTGWNWWSTYIEQGNIDGLALLERSLGHNGVTIKSQFDFVQNFYPDYGEDVWFGSLEGLANEQGYMINVTEDCSLSMVGTRAKPVSHPITIYPNWNWIGYPVASQQSVASALADYNALPDDLIKSHYEFSVYYDGFGWFPDDLVMTPGEGYFYYSNAQASQTLTYNNSRGEVLFEKSDKRIWKTNVHAYADNISIVAVVSIDSIEQRDENLELGAFVNGKCRGSARLRHFGPLDRYYAVLSVAGQEGDKVEFGFINKEKGQSSMNCENHVAFARNDVLGSLDTPYVVRFNTQTEADQNGFMVLFPNPVERNKTFSLAIPRDETLIEIVVIDMLGEEVVRKSEALKPSEISGLPVAGIYVVKAVTRSGNVYHGRLIVK